MDTDLRADVDSLKQQVTLLQTEMVALRKLLGVDDSIPFHELPRGSGISPKCEVIFLQSPGKESCGEIGCGNVGGFIRLRDTEGATGVQIGINDEGGSIELLDHEENFRVEMGVNQDGGSLSLKGEDEMPRVDLWVHEDQGHICVHTAGGKPRAGLKAMADGGVVNVVNDEGKPRAAIVSGKDLTEMLLLDNSQNICTRLAASALGGVISAQSRGKPLVSLATTNGNGALMVHDINGKTAVTVGNLHGDGNVSVYDRNGKDRVQLMVAEDIAWVMVSNKAGENVCALNSLNEAGYVEVCDAKGKPRLTLDGESAGKFTVRDNNDQVAAIVGAGESGGLVGIYDNVGKLAAAMDVEGNMDRPSGRVGVAGIEGTLRAMMNVDSDGQGVVSVLNGDGENRAMMSGQKEGGTFHSFGGEDTVLAVLGGTQHGGAITINNDLGISRAAMCVHKDGGQLQLFWAGSPVATLSAQETCGMMYLFDSDGDLKLRLPEDAPPEEI